MEIIMHARHREVNDLLRTQARRAVRRSAVRLRQVARAVVRFVEDGSNRRVEIMLRTIGGGKLVVQADDRAFAPALSSAIRRLESRVSRMRRDRHVSRAILRTGDAHG